LALANQTLDTPDNINSCRSGHGRGSHQNTATAGTRELQQAIKLIFYPREFGAAYERSAVIWLHRAAGRPTVRLRVGGDRWTQLLLTLDNSAAWVSGEWPIAVNVITFPQQRGTGCRLNSRRVSRLGRRYPERRTPPFICSSSALSILIPATTQRAQDLRR